jgi:hypothetical protein
VSAPEVAKYFARLLVYLWREQYPLKIFQFAAVKQAVLPDNGGYDSG